MPDSTPILKSPIPLKVETDDVPAALMAALSDNEKASVPAVATVADRDDQFGGGVVKLVVTTSPPAIWFWVGGSTQWLQVWGEGLGINWVEQGSRTAASFANAWPLGESWMRLSENQAIAGGWPGGASCLVQNVYNAGGWQWVYIYNRPAPTIYYRLTSSDVLGPWFTVGLTPVP